MKARHTTRHFHTQAALRGIFAVFAFLFAATLFTGCGGKEDEKKDEKKDEKEVEKKGQKEYEEGMAFFTAQQYEPAVKQFAAAANLGHAEAQFQLGLCFAEGKGFQERNEEEAFKWFQKAAEQGNAEAQFRMAVHFGADLDPDNPAEVYDPNACDDVETVKWLKKAAEQGNVPAQVELGRYYIYGRGVSKDVKEGEKWLKKASEAGSKGAKATLEKLNRN